MSTIAYFLGGIRHQRQHWQTAHLRNIVLMHFRLERLTLPARSLSRSTSA
jgi:hypothetical protein